MFSPQILISAAACILCSVGAYYVFQQPSSELKLPFFPSFIDPFHEISLTHPHSTTWTSWYHPLRQTGYGLSKPKSAVPQQRGGRFSRDWNILYHLGGNGPWVQKQDDVVHGGIAVPDGCMVDQVNMLSRHAERYPTVKAGYRINKPLQRIRDLNLTLKGDLEFLNSWKFITDDSKSHFEQLTTTGPFAGTLGAFQTGVRLRSRYDHLLSRGLSPSGKLNFWASDSGRVIDTARYFAAGFVDLSWEKTSVLHVIPETAERGADTLTPGDTCKRYLHDLRKGHDQGYDKIAEFRETYLDAARTRLLRENPEIQSFSDEEIFSLQELCAFETTVRGSSLFCDLFSREDWLNFEYARDILHFYRAGPGTPYAGPMGMLWLNATAELLAEGPRAGSFFFSFVHDGDIAPVLTALGIHDDEPLPTTHRVDNRKWRMSQATPMGGRLIIERISCQEPGSPGLGTYVRLNINDGIVALPTCNDGPGESCPLVKFLEWVQNRGQDLGDFNEICGLNDYEPDAPKKISFLHQ